MSAKPNNSMHLPKTYKKNNYDLAELFDKTPIFDVPPMNYELEDDMPWQKLSKIVLLGVQH